MYNKLIKERNGNVMVKNETAPTQHGQTILSNRPEEKLST